MNKRMTFVVSKKTRDQIEQIAREKRWLLSVTLEVAVSKLHDEVFTTTSVTNKQ